MVVLFSKKNKGRKFRDTVPFILNSVLPPLFSVVIAHMLLLLEPQCGPDGGPVPGRGPQLRAPGLPPHALRLLCSG